jgi:hypothetical protein
MITEPATTKPKVVGLTLRTWGILAAIVIALVAWGTVKSVEQEKTKSMSSLCAEIAAADFSKVPLSKFTDQAWRSEAVGHYEVWSALTDLENSIAIGIDTDYTNELLALDEACAAA